MKGPGWLNELGRWMILTAHTSISPIWRGFAPSFVNYKKGCTRLAAASDKDYQLLAHGRWFSQGTPASSTTKTGRHDIAEILLKVALNTKNQIIKSQIMIIFAAIKQPIGTEVNEIVCLVHHCNMVNGTLSCVYTAYATTVIL